MPKILLIHPFDQPTSGADESILAVMKHLVPQGWSYDVVLPGEGAYAPRYRALGCRIYTYPMSIIKRRLDIPFLAHFVWRFLPTLFFLRRVIQEVKPDIVHTNGAVIMGGGLAAWFCGVPSVYHIRCSQIAHPRPIAWVLAHLMGWTSARVMAISQACASVMTDRGFYDQTVVLPNGIDLSPFREALDRSLWKRECGWPDDALIVGQVGRMAPIKGWIEFVHVCAIIREKVPQARFVAVGGPFLDSEVHYEEEVHRAVSTAGLDDVFHFAGRRNDIPQVMAGLDLFITMAKEEGFGRVAVECMAAGCPILANRVGGLPDIVRDGVTGYLIGPHDVKGTAERAIQLLQNTPLRQQFSRRAQEDAFTRFSAEECALRTASVYREVLNV